MNYRTDVTPEQASAINIGEAYAIASLVYSGQAETAYKKLASSNRTGRARALAAAGSVGALSRTFSSMRSGSDTPEREKFTAYLAKLGPIQLHRVLVQENNFSLLLYSGFGKDVIPRLKAMTVDQQVAVLQTRDAIAQLITKGEKAFVREIAKSLPEAERDALFADKKWDSGTPITFESLIDKPVPVVKLIPADAPAKAPEPALAN